MKLARGKYLGFLNSDDFFTENAFFYLKNYIQKFPDKDFIFGAVKKHWGTLYGYKPYKNFLSLGFLFKPFLQVFLLNYQQLNV